MGVEIVNGDIRQVPVNDGIEEEKTFENKENHEGVKQEAGIEGMVEPIKFGSHGTDIPVQEEAKTVTNNFPKDAVDEWPEPKQIHSFYLIRIRPYEDPKLKVKIDQAEKEIQKKNQARFQLTDALKAKRSERAQIISQLKPLTTEDRQYRSVIDDRRKEMEPLHQALGKLRGANNQNREKGDKGVVICSSEQELDDLIKSLNYRIEHECNTLVEEKQILRDIKQLEGTRERVIANAAMKAKIQDSLGHKEAIQDQVKQWRTFWMADRADKFFVSDYAEALNNTEREANPHLCLRTIVGLRDCHPWIISHAACLIGYVHMVKITARYGLRTIGSDTKTLPSEALKNVICISCVGTPVGAQDNY